MGLHVHRSERTDALLHGLGQLLTDIPADAFTPEIVAVPTPGIERFITQGLGTVLGTSQDRADGVCANVDFPSPAAVVNRVISQASGIDPAIDPWLPHRAVWPLLAVIDHSAEEPWCAPLKHYLGLGGGDTTRQDRRFAMASRLAALFGKYASQRPSMLIDWAQGRDTDGAGAGVPMDLAWQPSLWRVLREEIALPSLAERLEHACAAVRSDPATVDLPDRLSVFGASRLPADQLRVLNALGEHRDVHLWLADASRALWRDPQPAAGTRRRDDPSATRVTNPLLRSLGRDARELRLRLGVPGTDEYLGAPLDADTLLGTLQQQIRDNRDPLTDVRFETVDRSIQVHACHGQARQAEVLREVLLDLLQSDSALEPRDILVMCPDLDAFAPLLSAAFSAPDNTGSLRLRIADRTPEQSNAVLAALAALLDMVTSRLQLSALLDFAALPPVRARFGFDDDALERIEDLTEQAGIRWGLDDQQRAQYQVRISTGTWAWGLDRLLLGAAMSQDGLPMLDGVLPVDDVNSGDVDLLGRLAELVTRLQQARDAMQRQTSANQWVGILSDALTDLTDARGADAWQLPNALGAMAGLADSAGAYADSVTLSLADIRWLLKETLQGRPTRSNFRSGDLTVCGLAPMRSVPHRVVCLVGMDDGAFPRTARGDGDDVLARDPLIGERDIRSEDRQLLLDAIMAATDHLVITYTGADERTNQPLPPCVPLGDLLDTLAAIGATRERVCVDHPLQPFHERNFIPGELGSPVPFSHDPSALAAARRATQPRQPAPSLLIGELPEPSITQLSPQEIATFLASPPKAFLRTRLGLSVFEDDSATSEQIPITLDGLEKWHIGERALRLLTHGESAQSVATAEWARGDLPPGVLGTAFLAEIGGKASEVAQRFAGIRTGQSRQVTVNITLPNGMRVVGTVPDVYDTGIVRATYSKTKPKHELQMWPELLALAATTQSPWTACLVTPDGGFRLTAPPADEALLRLAELVQLYRSGMCSPLPLPPATSCSYAKGRAKGMDVESAINAARFGRWQRNSNERADAEIVALWGPEADLSVLLDEGPQPTENWYDEDHRFGMLARHLWNPVLDAKGDL